MKTTLIILTKSNPPIELPSFSGQEEFVYRRSMSIEIAIYHQSIVVIVVAVIGLASTVHSVTAPLWSESPFH
jgi:hypothetical protein